MHNTSSHSFLSPRQKSIIDVIYFVRCVSIRYFFKGGSDLSEFFPPQINPRKSSLALLCVGGWGWRCIQPGSKHQERGSEKSISPRPISNPSFFTINTLRERLSPIITPFGGAIFFHPLPKSQLLHQSASCAAAALDPRRVSKIHNISEYNRLLCAQKIIGTNSECSQPFFSAQRKNLYYVIEFHAKMHLLKRNSLINFL